MHFKNVSIISICTSLFQNHLQFILKTAFMSSLHTLSTCSQGLSISQLLPFLWWSSELSVSCLLGPESIQTDGVKSCTLFPRQYTSRSAFPCVLTPISQGALNLLCGILQRPLFRSLGTKNGLQPLPPTCDIQTASIHANSKFPEETTVPLTNPANSSGHNWHTSTHATCQSRTCNCNMSNLLKKASPKEVDMAHTWEVTWNGYSSVYSTPSRNPGTQRDPPHWTDLALSPNNLNTAKMKNTSHWVPIVTRVWSFRQYGLLFMLWAFIFEWQRQLTINISFIFIWQFWSAEDGQTVYTLDNKIKYFISYSTSIMHSIRNWIYLILWSFNIHNDMKRYLPEDQHTVH